MAVVGIIAEYDPFHLGHRDMLNRVRRLLGADTAIVVAMSGSFTQRGGAAICSPAARAEMALRGGADLVLELPVQCAVASAEGFARGAVALLAATGVVDTLCFGSESGDLPLLRAMADAEQGENYGAILREFSAKGIPFAEARQQALEQLLGQKLPDGPNDLLATQYLRMLPKEMTPHAIRRTDGGHGGDRSASKIRSLLQAGSLQQVQALVPAETAQLLRREEERGCCPAQLRYAERAVLYRLRGMKAEELCVIADCSEGLEHRILNAAARSQSLEQLYEMAKSRRYAHARIRRIVLRAFLGITQVPQSPAYLGVLGADETGLALLRQMKTAAALPIITKPAHGIRLTGEGLAQYLTSRRADDLWQLCLPVPGPTGQGWKDTPILLH